MLWRDLLTFNVLEARGPTHCRGILGISSLRRRYIGSAWQMSLARGTPVRMGAQM